MGMITKHVGDTVKTHYGFMPLVVEWISAERPLPLVRVRSKWTGRRFYIESYFLKGFFDHGGA